MENNQQDMVLAGDLEKRCSNQRTMTQIKRLPRLLAKSLCQLAFTDLDHLNRQFCFGVNTLYRAIANLGKAGAKNVMACNNFLKAGLNCLNVQSSPQPQGHRDVIQTGFHLIPAQEPQAFLAKGQWRGLLPRTTSQQRLFDSCRIFKAAGQPSNGWGFKHYPEWQVHMKHFSDSRHYLSCQQ